VYIADGHKHRFRLCEGRGGLETKLVSVLIVSEEAAYLGQSRRIDFVKTGEGRFEGGSFVLQQLDTNQISV
jgi:hypothetical protein